MIEDAVVAASRGFLAKIQVGTTWTSTSHHSLPTCKVWLHLAEDVRDHVLTRNVLDCDQTNYSSRIIFSYTFTLEENTNWIGWTVSEIWYGHSKLYKTANGRDLGFGPTEVETFDPPTSKTLHRTKHEVDRMTRCRDMAIRNFPKCEVGRSVGRWSSILHCSHTLLFATLRT